MGIEQIEVKWIDGCGTDLSVVNAARVSFNKVSEWEVSEECPWGLLKEKDEKLIHYLAKHKHTSPFNHAFMSFHIKAPIFVARQLVKHEYLPWNEVSRRYVDDNVEFYIPDFWRKRADNLKQGSLNEEAKFNKANLAAYELLLGSIKGIYEELLADGVAPEQARMLLPVSTLTEWYWSGTLGAFAKMCKLRLDSHTQYETRIVAQKIDEIASGLFPVSWRALLSEEG